VRLAAEFAEVVQVLLVRMQVVEQRIADLGRGGKINRRRRRQSRRQQAAGELVDPLVRQVPDRAICSARSQRLICRPLPAARRRIPTVRPNVSLSARNRPDIFTSAPRPGRRYVFLAAVCVLSPLALPRREQMLPSSFFAPMI